MFIELYRAVLIYEIRRNVTIPNFIKWNSFYPSPRKSARRFAFCVRSYYKRRGVFWQVEGGGFGVGLPSQALRASSPGGRAKFTLMDRGKLCGKMNFFAALTYHKLCRN